MARNVKQMLEAANAAVPRITPAQAREMIAKDNTLVVDVRDAPEVAASGKVAGAVQVSRGMLEFRADPESPYHDKNFAKDKTVILYCASGAQGPRLRAGLQSRSFQGLGRQRRHSRKSLVVKSGRDEPRTYRAALPHDCYRYRRSVRAVLRNRRRSHRVRRKRVVGVRPAPLATARPGSDAVRFRSD